MWIKSRTLFLKDPDGNLLLAGIYPFFNSILDMLCYTRRKQGKQLLPKRKDF